MIKNMISLLCLVLLSACFNSDNSAVGVLREFVKKSSSGLEQRDYQNYATGDLLGLIEDMSEQEFEQYKEQSKVQSVKVEVLNENCSDSKCSITYISKYKTKTSDGSDYNSEVRKIAELSRENEKWKVSSVKNIKTYLETNEGLNPLQD